MSIFLYGQYLEHTGRLSHVQFKRLVQMFQRSQRSLVMRADDTLYLQVDYQTAYDRLKARNDPHDGDISVEFQRVCQDRFGQMCAFTGGFQGRDHSLRRGPVSRRSVGAGQEEAGSRLRRWPPSDRCRDTCSGHPPPETPYLPLHLTSPAWLSILWRKLM
jgi:hypothetical protein